MEAKTPKNSRTFDPLNWRCVTAAKTGILTDFQHFQPMRSHEQSRLSFAARTILVFSGSQFGERRIHALHDDVPGKSANSRTGKSYASFFEFSVL